MTTKIIPMQINVQTAYLRDQSAPHIHKFVWSYEVTIFNRSDEIVQLLNRFWRITDVTGKVEEVYGAGVIGLQPIIKPGKQFIYTSYCQLLTPQGTMEGHYEMQNLSDEHFAIEIPKFVLSSPATIAKMFRANLH